MRKQIELVLPVDKNTWWSMCVFGVLPGAKAARYLVTDYGNSILLRVGIMRPQDILHKNLFFILFTSFALFYNFSIASFSSFDIFYIAQVSCVDTFIYCFILLLFILFLFLLCIFYFLVIFLNYFL